MKGDWIMTRFISRVSLLLLLTALLAGCDEEQFALRMNHYLHVTENEMDCDECHGEPGKPSFSVMTHETCSDCHDEVDAKEISKKTCGYCHEEKQLPSLEMDWKPEPVPPRQKVFIHTKALADKCTDCHGEVLSKDLTTVPKLNRDDIVQIRDDAHNTEQDCLMCHIDMDRQRKPASHDHFWMKRHGVFGSQDDKVCGVCHTEDSCRQCHSIMMPFSHNNMWRLKTHGVMAAWDRQRCMVCHEEDSCVSCHSEARPRSHRARYRESHCTGCHLGALTPECTTCHEGGNSIQDHQEFWPADHDQFGFQVDCHFCHPL